MQVVKKKTKTHSVWTSYMAGLKMYHPHIVQNVMVLTGHDPMQYAQNFP